MPRLYLLPSLMSDCAPADVLPQRNIDIMGGLRHFVVENVRTARRFLRRCIPGFPIDDSLFSVLDVNTPASELPSLLQPLREGHDVGVISEAGCPAVADPGADLVAIAQKEGFEVVPLVGPSSILMALMGSGFNGQSFCFRGYLPIETSARRKAMADMAREARRGQTQIFIETPYRNNRLIAELAETLPADMLLCVASDITGPSQSILTLPSGRWRDRRYDYSRRPTIFLVGFVGA